MFKKLNFSDFFLLLCLIANVATRPALAAWSNETPSSLLEVKTQVQEFIFVAQCINGHNYQPHSYQMERDGLTMTFYAYQRPAGKVTLQAEVQPQEMTNRTCREIADARNAINFD
jgi:hypothetical protein